MPDNYRRVSIEHVVLVSLVASHHDLDLSVLDRLSTDAAAVGAELVAARGPVRGAVTLATCNRLELYVDVPDADAVGDARTAVARAVGARSGLAPTDVAAHLRLLVDREVSAHLFGVASGLESMVVGEREIAGQVRRALASARRDGTTTPDLETLFQAASRSSRAVEARTGIGATGRSVVGVALDLAERDLPDWSAVRCVLVGTGSYAGASLAALRARGCGDVRVFSPSGRAGDFASARGVDAVPPGRDLADEVRDADLVVACSGAAGPVLTAEHLEAARHEAGRDGAAPRPLTVLDLALLHDIDPRVGDLPGVHLVTLHTVAEHAPDEHAAVAEARAVAAEMAAGFEAERRIRAWDPAVVAERTRVLGGLEAALAALPEDARDERAERALRRRVRRALHGPTVRARAAARDGDGAGFAAALAQLAAIDVPVLALDAGAPA
ncbi:glutamyl-tRNA reductase [Cellulomonas marina]|uniref:glutamyl-tRNA reductase n=1 Tax=Cellulomonas marina TaxID=988821 RepID=UPI001EF19A3E|nr:glutamyl-tRNA reductase [Cellulomonas marina]